MRKNDLQGTMSDNGRDLTERVYSEKVEEWVRLDKDPFHRLELETSLRFLEQYLPETGVVLDVGSGPGRYAIELAGRGYKVVLVDLVPEFLAEAEKRVEEEGVRDRIKRMEEGNVTDLSLFDSNKFDAVLCLGGVLSHVEPESERKQAVSELVRVAKEQAPIFVSVMSKWGTMANFLPQQVDKVKDKELLREVYEEGEDWRWYGGEESYAHYFEVEELQLLLAEEGVTLIDTVGWEGLASFSKERINHMAENDPEAWDNWLKMHKEMCNNKQVAELSLHFMVIVRKK